MSLNILGIMLQPSGGVVTGVDLWNILLRTSLIGKSVILILFFISLAAWAIIFARWLAWRKVDRKDKDFIQVFHQSETRRILARAGRLPESGLAQVFQQIYRGLEVTNRFHQKEYSALRDRLFTALERTINEILEPLEKSLGFLATAAGVSPFIGLFGTVLGIIAAFENIGQYRTADLSVVAPGIAEALVATAMGLAAAIPALVAYNVFVHKNRKYRSELRDFGTYLIDRWTMEKPTDLTPELDAETAALQTRS